MKNIIFISPNFPANYWLFCRELRADGMNVLGIGDERYERLSPGLRENLTEYYKVDNLENYDSVYRAVAFLIFKYGPIDWLESNNEYWLERDAKLRTAFHITSGYQESDMAPIKFKSQMKEYYRRAGIPTARWHMVERLEDCEAFIQTVGYPVVVKPDNGVGASDTHKLTGKDDLVKFLEKRDPKTSYIMEEYVHAEVNSYDAIYNSKGEPMFETGNVTPVSIMDIVNDGDNSLYFILRDLPEDTRAAGRATAKAFGVRSRFIHFEFFRLTQDQEGLGKKGELVGLEVNMRPSGGYTPDMIDYAHGTNVYKVWADMIAFDKTDIPEKDRYFCAYLGRRDGKKFVLSHEEVMRRYGERMKLVGRIPQVLAGAMGDQMYIAVFPTREEMDKFFEDTLACQ